MHENNKHLNKKTLIESRIMRHLARLRIGHNVNMTLRVG